MPTQLRRRLLSFSFAAVAIAGITALLAATGAVNLFSSGQASCATSPGVPLLVTDEEDYLVGEVPYIEGCGLEDYEGDDLTLRIVDPNTNEYTDTVAVSGAAFLHNSYIVPESDGDHLVELRTLPGAGDVLITSTLFSTSRAVQSVRLNGQTAWTCTSGSSTNCTSTNGAAVTASTNATISVEITVLGTGNSNWRGTSWVIDGGGSSGCDDHEPDHTTNPFGSETETFNITTSATGTFDLYLRARSNDDCDSGSSGRIRLIDAITVSSVPNPPLPQACGLDIALAIDMSGSISSSGQVTTVKNAAKSFVNAFLPATPTQVGIVEFSDATASTVLGLSTNATTINSAIDGLSASGFTNWEEAILLSTDLLENAPDRDDSQHPDLMVVFTDGDPTASSAGANTTSQPNIHLAPAVAAANLAKSSNDSDPIRIIAVGVAGASSSRLQAISGDTVSPPAPIDEDVDVILSDFSELADALGELASELCGGTITVQKVIDQDGNLGTTGDQISTGPAVLGWNYNASVTGGSASPSSVFTDINGQGNSEITINSGSATVDLTEVVKTGYDLASASCTGGTSNGTFNSGTDTIDDIVIEDLDIVSCTFYNTVVAPGPCQSIVLDYAGLPAGTILNEQYAASGVHLSADADGGRPDTLMVFDSDATGTPDPDLEVDIGNVAVIPDDVTDTSPQDGIIDVPNDSAFGGVTTYTFDDQRVVNSFVFVDKDNPNPAEARVYDAVTGGTLLGTFNIPNMGDGSVQTINVGVAGVQRLEIQYPNSGAVNGIDLDCGGQTDVKITAQTPTAPASADAGDDFTISVAKTLHNNGPTTPVDVSITPEVTGPPDCTITPDGGNQTSATLNESVAVNVDEDFTVNCTEPSTHQFDIENCIAITSAGVSDTNSANDCWTTQQVSVDVLAEADIKVSSVSVSSPTSANGGASFDVDADATLHNNGGHGPTNVDTTFTLSLPGDCSTGDTNPVTVEDTSLATSAATVTSQVSWSVTCTDPSSHQFGVQASAAVDQLHVSDPTPGNSGNNGNDTTAINTTADLKVSGVTVTSPTSANSGANFVVTVAGTLHNNGAETPVNADATIGLSVPADCSATPTGGQDQQDLSLAQSAGTNVQATWDVSCTDPSNHQMDGSVSVSVDQLHVSDPTPGNDSGSGDDSTAIIDTTTDLKVSSVSVNAPASANSGATFGVTVTATLHNNGPVTPVNADATVGLSVPGDCSATPTGGQDQQDVSLPQSTPTNVQATWDVSCTDPSNHQFNGSASIVPDLLHVGDSNSGNDSNDGNANTAINATTDLKVTGVAVSAPPSANNGATFGVTVTATLHNNGTVTPVNADATVGLSVPADCTATPTGGQDQQDVNLAQSAATDVQATWDVSCTDPSDHQLDGSATVSVDEIHVTDSTGGNNSNNGNTSIVIGGQADVKVSSVTVTSPASAVAGATFNVTVAATLHNNGPITPANTDASLGLSAPSDCTATPTGGQDQQDVSLAQSTPTNVQATWDVDCGDASDHQFDGSASVTTDQLHVGDPNNGNNSGADDDTTAILDTADVKVSGVSVTSPASANVGAAFTVSATADLHNNGPETPANVDTTLTLNLPGDCSTGDTNPVTIEDTSLASSSTVATPQTDWSVTCTGSSNHQFSVDVSTAVDQLHVSDSTPGNNSNSENSNTAVNNTADLKVSSVTVTAPATEAVGNTFNVTVAAALHNNGPETPVNADATIGLSVPADCTATPTGGQDQQDLSLAQSAASNVQATWDVDCDDPSNHQFDGSASVSVDQVHVTDPTSGNDSNSGDDTTSITSTSDLKVSSVSVGAPASANAGQTFNVTVTATVHNNGPVTPVSSDTSIGLSVPADCTATPTGGQDQQNVSINQSVAANLQATWDVSCTDPSDHQFDGDATIAVDQIHVSDPTPANDSSGGDASTAILSEADLKVSGVSVSAPAGASSGATFEVTVTATLHNNGPETPANADATIGLSVPADCTATPTGGQSQQDVSLPQSSATNVQATWDVSCTDPSDHQLDGSASVALDQLHVSDGVGANDTNSGNAVTVIGGDADLKMNTVVVSAPPSAGAGAIFQVTVTANIHNNGPSSPVNADATIGLSGPADCSLTPTGGQDQQDLSLVQSAGQVVPATWNVSCTTPSNHQFDGDACVSIDSLHLADPTPGNNCDVGDDLTSIVESADLKVSGVSVSAPSTAAANAPFNVSVSGTIHNNGPATPVDSDTTIGLSAPADCNATPTGGQSQEQSLAQSVGTNVQATWSVSCTNASNHQFDGSVTIAVDQLHVNDSNSGNNSGADNDTTTITKNADLKVSSVTVDAPASANTGATLEVTVTSTVHNNGPATPVNAAASIGLSGPADCTLTPTGGQTQPDVSLAQSSATNLQATWDVSCTNPSNHQFDGTGSIAVDQLHITDTNTGNNNGGGNDTTSILALADPKVSSVTVDAPASANAGDTFEVTVSGTLHNNGPTTVNSDATLGLSGPGDCTLTPTSGQDQQDLALAQSVAQNLNATWDVSCTNPSNHQFDGSASVAIDQLHITDTNTGNNTGNGNDTTAISVEVDIKISGSSVTAPPNFTPGVPFNVSVNGTVHNNGPVTPVNADVEFTLTAPPDCSVTPTGGQDQQDVSLAASTATNLQGTWSVDCTNAGNHLLEGTVDVTVDQLHVTDPIGGNNTAEPTSPTNGQPATTTPTPPPGGGTPNPVGGVAGLLDAPDSAPAASGDSNGLGTMLILAAGVIALSIATAWALRKSWTR